METVPWMITISILLTFFSFMQMAEYLYRKKKINHRIAGIRIDQIYRGYVKDTLAEKGHIGLWLWVHLVNFPIGVILTFLQVFIIK
jgi:hypothetical protein